ncbi:MAG TPA: ubiquinol-cytochrome C chaperone family protein [Candidatus Polarisedimenticolia bacterium]|nr:ubiquinol-cytochrome C chaperone family protein [Candidatus Polarisedimenticolia bacterium]
MSLLDTLFRRSGSQAGQRALYAAIVARGRQPHWYIDGAVADTVDGRFDMIAAILALVLLRMETLGAADDSARLAEVFVTDMDGQLRQIGIGDIIVGKHIGRMMSALGGRLGAYRAALEGAGAGTGAGTGAGSLEDALVRNLYRGEVPAPEALAHVAQGLREFAAGLSALDLESLRAARLPVV